MLYVIRSNPFFFVPPLGLGYIASSLLKDAHTVSINDDHNYDSLDFRRLNAEISEFSPDIIGFTVYTFSVNACCTLAEWAKKIRPGVKIVFGGPHAACLPFETLSCKSVDIVATGEGEQVMPEIARAYASGKDLASIKGIAYRRLDGVIRDNGPREFIEPLDSLGFPAYDLLDMGKYYASVQFKVSSSRRFGTVSTSRGCPYSCTFCSHKKFGKKVRYRSPEHVVAELELLVKKYGVNEVLFIDDAFLLDKARAAAICEGILEKKLKLLWSCMSRADYASADLFSVLGKAGCRSVFIGAESGSQDMLDTMRKGITLGQIEDAVRLAKKHIGGVSCGFIFGMPGETVDTVRKTVAFAKKLDPDYATFLPLVPLPGSEIFDALVEKGRLDLTHMPWESFSKFPPQKPVFQLCEIAPVKLHALLKKAYSDFYFRPGYLWGRLSKLKSLADIYQYALAGFKVFVS